MLHSPFPHVVVCCNSPISHYVLCFMIFEKLYSCLIHLKVALLGRAYSLNLRNIYFLWEVLF